MTDLTDIVDPSGKPLIQEKKLIVVKAPKGVRLDPRLFNHISNVTGCAVLELPMTCELMMGDLAAKEIDSLHHGIHAILGIPDAVFTKEEMSICHSALRYLCEKTVPGDGSKEVALLKKTKQLVR